MRSAAFLATVAAAALCAAAEQAPPPPPTGCAAALQSECGAVLAGCASFPCAGCEMCIIANQTSLAKAGCTGPDETAFCAAPPPLVCKHTDSRGDQYDLTGVPKVDGKFTKIISPGSHGSNTAWYHVGICGIPTEDQTDPKKGCLPPCTRCDDPLEHCTCSNTPHGIGIDEGGEAVCQYDPAMKTNAVQYNLGKLDRQHQKWSDGSTAGQGVSLQYTGGSTRGGCGAIQRSTEIVVHCDPCNQANISSVDEPRKCHYRVNITSVAGCPTNKPLPKGNCPHLCDESTHQCKPVAAGTPGANSTLGECAASCKKAPPPPPPPPLSKNPCIRFGHTIPVARNVDVQIAQEPPGPPITHTWTNYKFGDFSDWVNVFKPGKGTITVWENVGGQRGALIYSLKGIPLTPGPLVAVIKVAASQTKNATGYWPPSLPDAVETIAASYVDTGTSSKIRLFNLSPDTPQAGMSSSANGTAEIATNVAFGLGSSWVSQPTATTTYTFKDDLSGKAIATRSLTPAAAPIGNTNVLLGLQSASGAFAVQAVPLVDAPEGGTCHP